MTVPYVSSWPDVSKPVEINLESARILLEHMKADRQAALVARDDARAELDNLVDGYQKASSACDAAVRELAHWKTDRDMYRDRLDDVRETNSELRCRLDELGDYA